MIEEVRKLNIEKMNVIKERLKKEYGDIPVFLIKFTKTKEYAQDIIDGKLHFSPIQNLRNIEKNGAKGQGDEYEVCSIKQFSKPATIILTRYSDSKKLTVPDVVRKITIQVESDKGINIFCIMGYEINDFNIINVNEVEVELSFDLNKTVLQDIVNMFGKYFVLFPADSFYKAVYNSFSQKSIEFIFQKCKYINPQSEKYINDIACANINRFFNKRKENTFIKQKEYRIVLTNPNTEPGKHSIEKFDCTFGINDFDEFRGINVTYTIPYIIKP